MMPLYFDVFPIHGQPEPFETLTSYTTRLAEANGIHSVDCTSALCFPCQDRRISRDLADYPPKSLDGLYQVGFCLQDRLLATTFFYLGTKFGRSTHPQAMSRFLHGCIATSLRYCPLCLERGDPPYYSLLWRFLVIQSCPVHFCKLLDTCMECGASLPLFTAPLKIGVCFRCGMHLKRSKVRHANQEELRQSAYYTDDLKFLLASWAAPIGPLAPAILIGKQFAVSRRRMQKTAIDVSKAIGATLSVIEGIERGNLLGRGTTFWHYTAYAALLNVPLRELILLSVQANNGITFEYPPCPLCSQGSTVTKAGHNHSGSQRYRCKNCSHYFSS